MSGGPLRHLADRLRAEFASRLARDSLLVFSVSALGRAIALGKEVLVAALFGLGGMLDAYVLALLVPSFLANMLGSTFSAALIPALGGVAARESHAGSAGPGAGARRFLARSLAAQALLVLAAGLGLAALPVQALHALAPSVGPERLGLVKALQTALLPLYVLGSLGHVLASLANYRGDFKYPALASTLGSLAAILGIALLHGRLGVFALVAGMNLGAALEFCILAWLARRAWGNVFRGWRSPAGGSGGELPALLRNWGLLALGTGLLGLSPFIDNAIASSLGEGSISALSYAWKLPSGLAGLLGLTLSTVLLPYFTGIVHNAPAGELLASCRRIMHRLLLFSAPLAVLGAIASPLLVALLFQRGRFDAQAADLVSVIQACYFVQLPFYLLGIAAARMLQALSRFRFLLGLQAALLLVNALTSYGLSRVLGVAGIAVSSTVMYLLSAGVAILAIQRHARRLA